MFFLECGQEPLRPVLAIRDCRGLSAQGGPSYGLISQATAQPEAILRGLDRKSTPRRLAIAITVEIWNVQRIVRWSTSFNKGVRT